MLPVCRRLTPRTSRVVVPPARRLLSRSVHESPSWLAMAPEVRAAVADNKPVVALESTIVSHGMPFPDNLRTALEVESVVRQEGAVPATVAILDGVVRVGLSQSELEWFAELGPAAITKTSRRDLPVVVGLKRHGSTTVSATMLAAHAAGVGVFVTGGVGGVHRGAEATMDVSADLTELGRTPVAVVCAGVKSILDIPKTLEVLETQGVTVLGLQCDKFPAFFTAASAYDCPNRVESEEEAAAVFLALQQMKLGHGMLLAVPNPEPAPGVEEAIEAAVADARRLGVSGKAETPFLLQRVNELSGGSSLQSNIALIRNNARVGARLACRHAALRGAGVRHMSTMVIGGAVVDLTSKPRGDLIMATSNPGTVTQSLGGVGLNVARTLCQLKQPPAFVSAVGTDLAGEALHASLHSVGLVDTALVRTPRTATYSAMLRADGELVAAVADMDGFDAISPSFVLDALATHAPSCVVLDANLPVATLTTIAEWAHAHDAVVMFEPTSVPKAPRVVESGALPAVSVVTPNIDEVHAMAHAVRHHAGLPPISLVYEAAPQAGDDADIVGEEDVSRASASYDVASDSVTSTPEDAGSSSDSDDPTELDLDVHTLAAAQTVLAAMCAPGGVVPSALPDGRKYVAMTLGAAGVFLLSAPPCSRADDYDMLMNMGFFEASYAVDMDFQVVCAQPADMISCTGAGDTLAGALVWRMLQQPMRDSVALGVAAARLSVQSSEAVSPVITPEVVVEEARQTVDGFPVQM